MEQRRDHGHPLPGRILARQPGHVGLFTPIWATVFPLGRGRVGREPCWYETGAPVIPTGCGEGFRGSAIRRRARRAVVRSRARRAVLACEPEPAATSSGTSVSVSFPQLGDVRMTHRWAGVIDTTSRFTPVFGTAHGAGSRTPSATPGWGSRRRASAPAWRSTCWPVARPSAPPLRWYAGSRCRSARAVALGGGVDDQGRVGPGGPERVARKAVANDGQVRCRVQQLRRREDAGLHVDGLLREGAGGDCTPLVTGRSSR